MPLFIPSPPDKAFDLGPLTIRYYALCLIAGIAAGWWLGSRRWKKRGGPSEAFETALFWAIPCGIVGARIYHVLTHLDDYFGEGINPWSVFYIWEGGIAIFGAIGGGALGAWFGCRRAGAKLSSLADSLAPGIALGQAIGRFGNWFNQELYGQPTDLPWALEIDPVNRVKGYTQYATFHPTFLYESVWNLFVCGALLFLDRQFKLGRGKVMACYIALYGFGRIFTEGLRLDYSYDTFGPIRFNQAVAMLICLAGLVLLGYLLKAAPGREGSVMVARRFAADVTADADDDKVAPGAIVETELGPSLADSDFSWEEEESGEAENSGESEDEPAPPRRALES
ncbi:MAG: prolipoprotein diacylglyceryl transferase [Propionibacteriaceae bacterium]|nr:prolipoprotein diacylglyceryl transferase [Propionibacteriaceae bacterium]